MGDRVAVVPKPKKIPAYRYLFYIFDIPTWCILLFSIFTLRVLYFGMSHIYGVYLNYLIMIWSPLVNLGIPVNLINKARQKWLLVIWIYSSVVLGVCFQTSLTTSFVKPRHEKSIKTVEDLRNSQMKIYIHPFLAQPHHIPDSFGLKKYFVYMEIPDSIQHMKNRNTSGAFVISRQLAMYYINQNKRISGDPVYEIVNEVVIPGSRVYLLQKNSPFLKKINRCMLLIEQYALLRKTHYKAVTSAEGDVLKLSHFLVIFYILALGYLTAFGVFLMEIYLIKFR